MCPYVILRYRLTADDIRKQHPRVLANELETLRNQNQRLEEQIYTLEQDAQKHVSQLQKLVSQEVCNNDNNKNPITNRLTTLGLPRGSSNRK